MWENLKKKTIRKTRSLWGKTLHNNHKNYKDDSPLEMVKYLNYKKIFPLEMGKDLNNQIKEVLSLRWERS